jgi:ubiquinol-cytochrome c reductase cytochrome c1 subunit
MNQWSHRKKIKLSSRTLCARSNKVAWALRFTRLRRFEPIGVRALTLWICQRSLAFARDDIFVLCTLFTLILTFPISTTHASEGGEKLPHLNWHFDGITGTYDKAALQRGFQVYREICAGCHSMNRVYYRNLTDAGFSADAVKAIASEYLVTDGPNDEGEMFERPAMPSDAFVSPYPNKKMAAYANNGAYPPDMSLLVKARHGGANYIYAILTGYEDPPHGQELMDGQYWNKYMPGHVLAMAQPLYDEMITYEDGSPETLDQYARDVSEFLAWAAEPHMEARKRTGIKTFLFLLVFTVLMYAVKRKVWAKVKGH